MPGDDVKTRREGPYRPYLWVLLHNRARGARSADRSLPTRMM
jgi:hypothetical protein